MRINKKFFLIISLLLITAYIPFIKINLPILNNIKPESKLVRISATYTSLVEINATDPTRNWAVAKSAGICTGEGTAGDPYVIKDHIFSISSGRGLIIENSRVYFRIENCSFYNTAMDTTIF